MQKLCPILDEATITLDLGATVYYEGDGLVELCALVNGLPSLGLGTEIAVDLEVLEVSAGMKRAKL